MNRSGKRRYDNSIERTFEIKIDKPARGLVALKVVVALLIVLVIAGSVFFVSRLYFSDEKKHESAASETASEVSDSDELLRVVNKTASLDKTYVPKLKKYDGYSVSVLADEELGKLLKDAKKSGVKLSVESAYISYDEQDKLYQAAFKANLKKYDLTEVRAQAKTETVVPQAGNSEAQTGLLVTFKTSGIFDGSDASAWLRNNCVKYGFVERYTKEQADETSMRANPKAYRYVGIDNADMMRSLNKSLNEYVVYINSR